MNIIPFHNLGSPAAIIHGDCNTVYVEAHQWDDLSQGQQDFIFLHEQAHCRNGIEGELEADAEALSDFMLQGGDPRDAIAAIMLLPDGPNRAARIQQINEQTMCTTCDNHISYFGAAPPVFDDISNPLVPDDMPSVQQKSNVWDALGSAFDAAGNIFGQRPQYEQPVPSVQPSGGMSNSVMLVIGLAVAAVVVAFMLKKR